MIDETILDDSFKENAALRVAISEAWQEHYKFQEEFVEARNQIQELTKQNEMLSQYLMDTSVGFECLPSCNSNGHDNTCPVKNPVAAWRLTRQEVTDLKSRLEKAEAELNEYRRIEMGLD